jgi:hypothetical protein
MRVTSTVFAGDALRLTFDEWSREAYGLFLRSKALPEHQVRYDEDRDAYTIETPARFARILGIEEPEALRTPLPLHPDLWDYQTFLVRTALAAKRYAIWADTGLGKTPMEHEWARQVQAFTGGRVLLVYFLNLIPQVLAMADQFYGRGGLSLEVLESRTDLRSWAKGGAPGIGIVNPEKFIPRDGDPEAIEEISFLAGVGIDESSILKTGGGKTKWALIKSCRGVEFKASFTATPAPNDPLEYASQASFLEKIRDEGEVIWTFFTRDADGDWKVKDHALEGFYAFLSGWSCYLRNPARYGFRNNLKDLPEPVRIEHRVPVTAEQLAHLNRIPNALGQTSLFEPGSLGIVERTKLGQLASGFLYGPGGVTRVHSLKPSAVASIVREDVRAGLQVLVWTLYDETAEILAALLEMRAPGDPHLSFAVLTGKVPVADRPAVLDRYTSGKTDVLITRARVLGFGSNLQNCGSMVFADFNDSAEQIYQAERRAYRYGQTRSVRIHFPIVPELQGAVWSNVQAKQARFLHEVERMEGLYVEAMRPFLEGAP